MIFLNLDVINFKSALKNKKVICFGSGEGFQNFCSFMNDIHLREKISCVVDNQPAKWNTYCYYLGEKFKIISPNELRNIFSQRYVLVVTCKYLKEILDQVSSYPELDQGECFFYDYLINFILIHEVMNAKMPVSMRTHKEIQIPKVIHYCWFGHKPIPDQYKEWMKSWRKYCPDYEIVEWNENNYDITNNAYMKQAYDAKKWGFVPDYARMDIIYKYGGIYLDTDVEIVKPLDDLLYQNSFCGIESNFCVAFGLGFGAKKGMDIIKKLRDEYDSLTFNWYDDMRKMIPAPVYQTKFLKKNGYKKSGDFQEVDGLRIYPARVLSGMIGYDILHSPETYAIHHYSGSWLNENMRKRNEFLRDFFKKNIIDT